MQDSKNGPEAKENKTKIPAFSEARLNLIIFNLQAHHTYIWEGMRASRDCTVYVCISKSCKSDKKDGFRRKNYV